VLGVVGTHTHVPTADGRVLPGGTAYVTDVGMTGSRGGVIGVKREQAVQRFVTQLPVKFETAEEDPWVMGCLIESGEGGLARSVELVMTPVESVVARAAGRIGVLGERQRAEQRDQEERREPHDVQVEPVRQ
jgi:calcineurin-like phosphoesterase